MRKHFDEEMRQARNEFISMAALVDKALVQSLTALENNDVTLAQEAISLEAEVIEYERLLERRCMLILLYQQPVASDLRTVSAILKMITELHRMQNQTSELSQLVIDNSQKINYGTIEPLVEMAHVVRRMSYDAVHSFSVMDQNLAKEVISRDDQVDELFLAVKSLIVKGIKKDEFKTGAGVDGLMISKYLEKIGDYAVSIAAWTNYMISGESVDDVIQ